MRWPCRRRNGYIVCLPCTLLMLSFPPRKTTRDRWEASAAGSSFAGELQATLGANEPILVIKCFELGSIPYVFIRQTCHSIWRCYNTSTLRSWLDPQTLQNLNTAQQTFCNRVMRFIDVSFSYFFKRHFLVQPKPILVFSTLLLLLEGLALSYA